MTPPEDGTASPVDFCTRKHTTSRVLALVKGKARAPDAPKVVSGASRDIIRGIDAFAAQPNGALIVLPPPQTAADRETIRPLATQYRRPAIYTNRDYVTERGLMSYGANYVDVAQRGSSFVDRIVRGPTPGDLPVEYPTKFELVINLMAAKAIGLSITELFLLRADELIE